MGYYIETGSNRGKAKFIADNHGGQIIRFDDARRMMNDGSHDIIVVMDNGPFEAAGFAYDMEEFKAFTDPNDFRPRQFVALPKGVGRSLSNCNR